MLPRMWYIYTMEYYSAIKNNDFMKFAGKLMQLENITDHMKPKKKKDQNVDGSMLFIRMNKILTGGNMETKCEAETE